MVVQRNEGCSDVAFHLCDLQVCAYSEERGYDWREDNCGNKMKTGDGKRFSFYFGTRYFSTTLLRRRSLSDDFQLTLHQTFMDPVPVKVGCWESEHGLD